MVLTETLNFRGSKGRADLLALFDRGSTYSCLSPELAAKLGNLERLPDPMEVETADKGHFIRIEDSVRLDFYLHDLRLTDEFMVVPWFGRAGNYRRDDDAEMAHQTGL